MAPTAKPQPKHARGPAPAEPNLIITIDERHRRYAELEVRNLLSRIGVDHARITEAPGNGLLGVRVADDPRDCVQRLRSILSNDPIAFEHTHRWLPIEEWARAEAAEVARFAQHAQAGIAPDETWGIKLERHGAGADRMELVSALARDVNNRRVDLEHPDKTVLLEIVGDRAGMALVEDAQMLSVDQEIKRQFLRFEELP